MIFWRFTRLPVHVPVLQMSIPDENGQAAVIDKSEGPLPKLPEGQLLGPKSVAILDTSGQVVQQRFKIS